MTGARLDRVTMHYRKIDRPAVDNLSLEVAPGEFMVIMGESGSGKTTLLRLIAGLEKASEGDIYLGEEWMNDTPVGRRPVQLIFQSLALWPHLNVMDAGGYSNLSFPLKVRMFSPTQIMDRVREVANRVGLHPSLYGRKPDELSGGERQRVALARAMVTESKIFLMDEPLSSLDPIARPKMRDEIRRLHDELGATTLYVTHNVSDATTMADRIAIMREGKIVQVASLNVLRSSPVEPYVTQLLTSY